MGKQIGMSQNTIHNIESGEKSPRISEIKSIADFLEVDITELIITPVKNEFHNCQNCGHYKVEKIIVHQFPDEIKDLLKKLVDKL